MDDKSGNIFSWGKFFSGVVSPLNFAKSFVFLIQAGVIIVLIFCLVFTVLKVKSLFFKPPRPAATFTMTGTQGGQIHNSTDEIKKKFGLINVW